MDTDDQVMAAVIAREDERRAALVADDMVRLAAILADDLVHVHATGIVHAKVDVLHHAGAFLRFLAVERGPLLVRRLAPAVAVMTGALVNTVRRRDVDERVTVQAFCTQLWVRRDRDWQLVSFHAVRTPTLQQEQTP